jgi:hypothetical protein
MGMTIPSDSKTVGCPGAGLDCPVVWPGELGGRYSRMVDFWRRTETSPIQTRPIAIPRRKGDIPDPRGGIRWIIPAKAKYR